MAFVVKSMFFDRQKVLSAAHKAKLRNLSKAGAFIRTTDVRSMRYRKGASKPGQPPFAHKPNAFLRKRTFFGYDSSSGSVVVGPDKLNVSKIRSGTVPAVVEVGGRTQIEEVQFHGQWKQAYLVADRAGLPTRLRSATIAPRPHLGPALKANLPKLGPLWANSIVG